MMSYINHKFRLFNDIMTASEQGSVSAFSLVKDMVKCRLSATRLSPQEYLDLGLFDHQRFSSEMRTSFAGTWLKFRLLAAVNDPHWSALGNDKLALYTLLDALHLPHPKIYAIACQHYRYAHDIPCLTDRDALQQFLSHDIQFPYFAKPIKGWRGVGGFAVIQYDAQQNLLTLKNHQRLSIDDFINQLIDETGYGYLFQQLLMSHPDIVKRCGNTLSTCRLVLLVHDSGPVLYRTLWKIPSGNTMIDNFQDGKTGNMLAAVDNDSGRIERIINGIGLDQQTVTYHPITKETLLQWTLPNWQETRELCFKAATCLPGVRIQSWDVALTDQGPVLIEMNPTGDLHGSQYVDGKGIFDQQMQDFINAYQLPQETIGPLFAKDRKKRL